MQRIICNKAKEYRELHRVSFKKLFLSGHVTSYEENSIEPTGLAGGKFEVFEYKNDL